jgi:hypothetical protein
MPCSDPPPRPVDQITAALDGVAAPEVRAHLGRCEACAARLAQARQLEAGLRASLRRWDCPAPQQLADYHLGRLEGAADRAIARHLAICASCAQEVEALRVFLLADEPPAAPAVPAPAPLDRSRRGPLLGRRLPQAAALRGGAGGPIQAQAGDTTVFLDVQPAGAGQVVIQGQIVDDDQERWAGALVELRQGGALPASAAVDDLGSFGCGPLPAGPTELRATPSRGRMVILPDLDLGG